MCLPDKVACNTWERFCNAYQRIGEPFAAEKALYTPSHLQPLCKLLLPLFDILIFHLPSCNCSLQKMNYLRTCYFTCMQGHTHAITTQRSDHACCIANHQYMILHL